MMPTTPNPAPNQNGAEQLDDAADALQRESERLRQLADDLKAHQKTQAEMQANYPHFKRAVYATLREQFDRELVPLPDKDLETLAKEEDALPLEAFIKDLERLPERT